MSGPEFFQTRMGHTFYEGTMPTIARSLKSIAESLEKMANPLFCISGTKTGRFRTDRPNQANVPKSNPDAVPEDLKAFLEANDGILDELIHDEQGAQASGINNEGWNTQIEFLRANGWSWNEIRKAVGCAIPEESLIEQTRQLDRILRSDPSETYKRLLAFRERINIVINGINWPDLHKQKAHLLTVVFADKENPDPLEGIVNLLDALQDAAHEAGIWQFPEEKE